MIGISPPLVGRLRSQYSAGISCGDRIVGNTLRYHAASPNDDVTPDLDAGKYHCIGTNPYIVANCDGLPFIMTIVVVLTVIGTCYANVGPDSYVRAKDDAIHTLDVTAAAVAWIHPVTNSNSFVVDHY